jgi:hypothetical protein
LTTGAFPVGCFCCHCVTSFTGSRTLY